MRRKRRPESIEEAAGLPPGPWNTAAAAGAMTTFLQHFDPHEQCEVVASFLASAAYNLPDPPAGVNGLERLAFHIGWVRAVAEDAVLALRQEALEQNT